MTDARVRCRGADQRRSRWLLTAPDIVPYPRADAELAASRILNGRGPRTTAAFQLASLDFAVAVKKLLGGSGGCAV